MPATAPLRSDVRTDVCVIGAGIAGLSTAYHLVKSGLSVAVLDAGPIGGGETGRTTAHLSNAYDDRYYGTDGSRLIAESHTAAIDRIEAIVATERIDCDFERLDGYLFVPPGESTEELDRELEAAHQAGLTDVERVARAPLPCFDTGPCLRFPRQGQFHPLRYLAASNGSSVLSGPLLARRIRTAEGDAFSRRAVYFPSRGESAPPGQRP